MARIGPQLLKEIQSDLRQLKRAHTWHKIGLVLFNRDGSYAAKVLSGTIIPSESALDCYLIWKPLNDGGRAEASPELCAAVWRHLYRGKEFSQTSREMADYFLIHRRKIRKACSDLVIHGWKITDSEGNVVEEVGPKPVGSCQAGYYRIVKPSEQAQAVRKLWAHERGIRKKRISLSRIRLVDPLTKGVIVADGVRQFQLPQSDLIEAP